MSARVDELTFYEEETILKYFFVAFSFSVVGAYALAQSTCMTRCEEVFGFGSSHCPKMCKEHPDGLKRKKTERPAVEGSSASAAVTSASQAGISEPKGTSKEKKDETSTSAQVHQNNQSKEKL